MVCVFANGLILSF